MLNFSLVDRYPELRELEIRELARKLLSDGPGPILLSLERKIEWYTCGELPYAKRVISALYELMENDDPVEEISLPVTATSNQRACSGDWVGLKMALTNSLTSGTFLDSQFYAVESRVPTGLPKIRPIYFSSVVSDSFTSELTKCRPYDSEIEDGDPDKGRSMDCYPRSKWFADPLAIIHSKLSLPLPTSGRAPRPQTCH
jgi:hypothetical protein